MKKRRILRFSIAVVLSTLAILLVLAAYFYALVSNDTPLLAKMKMVHVCSKCGVVVFSGRLTVMGLQLIDSERARETKASTILKLSDDCRHANSSRVLVYVKTMTLGSPTASQLFRSFKKGSPDRIDFLNDEVFAGGLRAEFLRNSDDGKRFLSAECSERDCFRE